MKLKFKRFLKRFLIVTVISAFLFCFLTISSSAIAYVGNEYNTFDYSDLIFSGVPEIHYWPTNDPSIDNVVGDDNIYSISYSITSKNALFNSISFKDNIFTYGNTYEILLRFRPSDDLKIPDHVFYGSYTFHLAAEGNGFFPIPDSVTSYRTGVDSSTNTAVVDYALVNGSYPGFISTFSAADSDKVIYDYYYLKFRFTYGWNSASSPKSFIYLYLYDVNFQSMSFSQFDNLYGWDSPVNTPSSGALDDMTTLEDNIIGGTSEGRQNTIDLFSNFSLVPWLRKGFLATTHVFNLFSDIPAINEILKFSLIIGSFAFIVGMSISLVKKR